MIKFIKIIGCFFLISSTYIESIFTYSVSKLEGGNISLSAFQGKKMIIITVPTVHNNVNDSLLASLNSLALTYASSVKVIAVPSYEDGYSTERVNELKFWYSGILNSNILITDGMYTRKTSGAQQSPLFKWLTDNDKNGHFNQDVFGPMQKFIIWTDGELSAVLGAPTKLNGSTINDLLSGQ